MCNDHIHSLQASAVFYPRPRIAHVASYCEPVFTVCRVEGKGKAVITDVIYSSKESCDDGQVPMGNKEEYQCILVCEQTIV